jgi:WD40 repeat protein
MHNPLLAIAVIFGAWLISLGEYELSFTLTGHNAKVYSVAILPNGDIVSGSADKYIKVWDYQKKNALSLFLLVV